MSFKLNAKYRKEVVQLLTKAAEIVQHGNLRGACIAITEANNVLNFDHPIYVRADRIFTRLFERDAERLGTQGCVYFFEDNENNDYQWRKEEFKNRRVLGLLLCAHLVEIGAYS